MSGIKCLGNAMRFTSRITGQVRFGVCKNITKDIIHSKRKSCTLSGLNWPNADISTSTSMVKHSYRPPVALGCLATISPQLIDGLSQNSCSDMLDSLGSDDDSDTWSYI
ncbi:uncharacterized protein LOC114519911 [Dendronephthya gigantea]|uniref:uncharacterized protein LOC114519911 n=1 Tax=Dendronephthya gigantea TaxID=151771 RepID=UPI00106DA5D6|nr:uncharacterized protein LOC114519911 [Dendronephthya gigantea]